VASVRSASGVNSQRAPGGGSVTSLAHASGSASGGKRDATTAGTYYRGMATFIIAKGGLMYEASVSGQKFTYTPLEKG
jgi:hypothetical protein